MSESTEDIGTVQLCFPVGPTSWVTTRGSSKRLFNQFVVFSSPTPLSDTGLKPSVSATLKVCQDETGHERGTAPEQTPRERTTRTENGERGVNYKNRRKNRNSFGSTWSGDPKTCPGRERDLPRRGSRERPEG